MRVHVRAAGTVRAYIAGWYVPACRVHATVLHPHTHARTRPRAPHPQVPAKLGFAPDPITGSVQGLRSPRAAGPARRPQAAGSPAAGLAGGAAAEVADAPMGADGGAAAEEEEGGGGGEDGAIAHVVSPLLARLLRAVASPGVQRTCRVGAWGPVGACEGLRDCGCAGVGVRG